jgi:5-formyltetrahydrofolate cyclo-ligase
MTKAELRKLYKAKRRKLSDYELSDGSLAIANQLLKMDIWHHEFFQVFLTIDTMREVNTENILHILAGKDKQVVLSQTDFETSNLRLFLLKDDTKIRIDQYGIPEPVGGEKVDPKQIDVVFVPLLAYDERGYRIGYGKGIYDNFLLDCRPDVIKIGLSLYGPEALIEDTRPQDVAPDFCVTPDKVYSFTS